MHQNPNIFSLSLVQSILVLFCLLQVNNMFHHKSLGVRINIRVTKLVLLHIRPVSLIFTLFSGMYRSTAPVRHSWTFSNHIVCVFLDFCWRIFSAKHWLLRDLLRWFNSCAAWVDPPDTFQCLLWWVTTPMEKLITNSDRAFHWQLKPEKKKQMKKKRHGCWAVARWKN